jgi:hypothetical protein
MLAYQFYLGQDNYRCQVPTGFGCHWFYWCRPKHCRGHCHFATSPTCDLEFADEHQKEDWGDLPDWCGIFVSIPYIEDCLEPLLTTSSASITSIVRLKFVVKYSNSFDSTWDNVDVLKWSLIEILSACICGNLLPLRPLVERFVSPFRSVYTWYSDRRSQRRSSEKTSFGTRSFGRFSRSGASSKPNLISSLHFTQISLSPTPTSGRDWKDAINSDTNTMASPRTPNPVLLENNLESVEEDYVQEVPYGVMSKTSTTVTKSTQTKSTLTTSERTMTDSADRPSRDGSERDLVPPSKGRENRISGPWSRAFDVLYRR